MEDRDQKFKAVFSCVTSGDQPARVQEIPNQTNKADKDNVGS